MPAGLEWGYYDNRPRKKTFSIWCGACGVYVAIMKGNAQHCTFEITSDGRCDHWKPSVEQKYNATARRVLLGEAQQ